MYEDDNTIQNIVVIVLFVSLLGYAIWYCNWYYKQASEYPECNMSRDIVTCVNIAKQR